MQSLEHFSRRWITWELDRLSGLGVIEAALLCDRLAEKDQIDLACHLALCLVRGAWAAGAGDALAAPLAGAAAQLFDTYAAGLWEKCGDDLLYRTSSRLAAIRPGSPIRFAVPESPSWLD